ncbi:RidA family protein [Nocardioides sp. YIM 152315]|uniref:RidA family protein n=1 Tax=Nocardioides sp. YIM 152315 TaxID=3031760 RepID=UPI0023D9C5B6|nr:RidA family protein [Nocardioides sp. YIM 152315]MDF1605836.1 RidA family protein [Nocardioides sp. YIM 152315]
MSVTYHPVVPTLAKFGDYSPISEAGPGELVVVAGQFGTDNTGAWPNSDSAEDQVRGAFANVGNALAAVGLDFSHVVKFQTFLVGRDTIPPFMATRKEVFAEIYPEGVYPPNTLLIVAGLVEERFRVEIEALAVRPAGD